MAKEPTKDQQLEGRSGRAPLASGAVVAVTALVTASVPLATAVHGYVQKSKEVALAERDQDFRMRMALLDRAIDSARSPTDRHQVLRFMQTASIDPQIAAWAAAELGRVDKELEALRAELDSRTRALAAAEKALLAERAAHEKARADSPGEARASQARLAAAEGARRVEQLKVAELQLRLSPEGSGPSVHPLLDVSPGTTGLAADALGPMLEAQITGAPAYQFAPTSLRRAGDPSVECDMSTLMVTRGTLTFSLDTSTSHRICFFGPTGVAETTLGDSRALLWRAAVNTRYFIECKCVRK